MPMGIEYKLCGCIPDVPQCLRDMSKSQLLFKSLINCHLKLGHFPRYHKILKKERQKKEEKLMSDAVKDNPEAASSELEKVNLLTFHLYSIY